MARRDGKEIVRHHMFACQQVLEMNSKAVTPKRGVSGGIKHVGKAG